MLAFLCFVCAKSACFSIQGEPGDAGFAGPAGADGYKVCLGNDRIVRAVQNKIFFLLLKMSMYIGIIFKRKPHGPRNKLQ